MPTTRSSQAGGKPLQPLPSCDRLLPIWPRKSPPPPPQSFTKARWILGAREQGLRRCRVHPAACGLWVRRAPPPPPALQPGRLHQLSPAAAVLDAETCVQTKRKRGGARCAGAPLHQEDSSPASLYGPSKGVLRGFRRDPRFSSTHRHHIHTLWPPLK